MKKVFAVTAVLVLLCLGSLAQAITIETVRVGDPGNAGELSGNGSTSPRICGAVGYTYNVGKYEVTAVQYAAFLNAVASTSDPYGLYNTCMWTEPTGCMIKRLGTPGSYYYSAPSATKPVNYVGYWDACRFVNWLSNGQPIGTQDASTTERGTYTLDGYVGPYGGSITRNAGARWAITNEDEWYKAAYYKGGGTNAGYWDYPTRSNTAPANRVLATDPGNSANYYSDSYHIGHTTNVGEFENSASAYGTFDQGGNVLEWIEAVAYPSSSYDNRMLRGGSFAFGNSVGLEARYRACFCYPDGEGDTFGFRVTYVPEPSSIIALLSGLAGLLVTRRRRA